MKKKLSTVLLAALLALPLTTNAQVTAMPITGPDGSVAVSGPGYDALTFLTNPEASNWMAFTYAIKTRTAGWGAGFGALYLVNDFVGATLRVDVFDHSAWMPQCNIQLQAPLRVMGRKDADGVVSGGLLLTPLVTTGIATQLHGAGDQQGQVVAVFGAGIGVGLPANDRWWQPDAAFYVYEKWSDGHGSGSRFGVTFKF